MDKTFLKAFAEVVREEVARKHDVTIEGLGTFTLEHSKQYQKQFKNGRVVMMPPNDAITFTPENK